jgi:hypothetical protein
VPFAIQSQNDIVFAALVFSFYPGLVLSDECLQLLCISLQNHESNNFCDMSDTNADIVSDTTLKLLDSRDSNPVPPHTFGTSYQLTMMWCAKIMTKCRCYKYSIFALCWMGRYSRVYGKIMIFILIC